jgi:hypothetical protein
VVQEQWEYFRSATASSELRAVDESRGKGVGLWVARDSRDCHRGCADFHLFCLPFQLPNRKLWLPHSRGFAVVDR